MGFLDLLNLNQAGQNTGLSRLSQPQMNMPMGQDPNMLQRFGSTLGQLGQQMQVREPRNFKQMQGMEDPSSVREYQYWASLPPEQQQEYLRVKRAQQVIDLGGTQAVLDPVVPGIGQSYDKTLPPEQLPSTKGRQTLATGEATRQTELKTAFPKVRNSINGLANTNQILQGQIQQALQQAQELGAAGFGSTALSKINDTRAKNLQRTLDSIRSNVAFARLQEMRDNSPTGGALGNVSDTETRLLSSVFGSLETDQGPQQLMKSLQNVSTATDRSLNNAMKAYQTDFAPFLGNAQGFGAVPMVDFNPALSQEEFNQQWSPNQPPVTEAVTDVSSTVNSPDGVVSVMSEEEALALPPNTRFKLPDGRTGMAK